MNQNWMQTFFGPVRRNLISLKKIAFETINLQFSKGILIVIFESYVPEVKTDHLTN